MNKEYILEGLGCANCAAKIEKAVMAREDVLTASASVINSTLKVEFKKSPPKGILEEIEKIVHTYEPDVAVSEKESRKKEGPHGRSHGWSGGKKRLAALIAGAAVFGAAICLENFFHINIYLNLAVFLAAYLILGGGVIWRALKNIAKGQIFDENFLMSAATAGAFATGNFTEAAAVMLFYQIGEFFQELALRRSRRSIAELMDIRPDYANLKTEKGTARVAPDTVKIGDRIVVKPGERIPLDGEVTEGESMLDTSALTGESVPRRAAAPDTVLSGCVNLSGVLTVRVTKAFGESTAAKIIDLASHAAAKKAPAESFITKFSRYYTPAVVGMAALLALLPPLLFNGSWSEWVNRGLIFLVISCPCALVVSIPLAFFGGVGGASRKGVLVKGGNYLEALNSIEIAVFDKTGTLTKGVFEVTKIIPAREYSEEALLEIAAKAEAFSGHPIALSVIRAYGGEPEKENLSAYTEIPGRGISVISEGKRILVGSEGLMRENNISFAEPEETGTKIYAAVDGGFAGCIVISDKLKADSRETVAELKKRGVRKTVMLTGDNPRIAENVAKELGLDEFYAGLLPGGKVEIVERLNARKSPKGKLAFIGDGINDAPVLARADVGIAMGGLGSDAAIEAADVVLMTDEPSKLIAALEVAGFTRRVVWQNIVFALGIKGLFLVLGAFGLASMWEAVFADVGVALLAVFNAMRVVRRK